MANRRRPDSSSAYAVCNESALCPEDLGPSCEYYAYNSDEWIPDPDISVTCHKSKMDMDAVFLSLLVISSLQIGLGLLFWVRLALFLRPVSNRRCNIVAGNTMFWVYYFGYNR